MIKSFILSVIPKAFANGGGTSAGGNSKSEKGTPGLKGGNSKRVLSSPKRTATTGLKGGNSKV